MQKQYGIYFTKGFILLIDELLQDYYDKSLKKEDFLHLFYVLEKSNEENNLVPLPRNIRNNFGRSNGQWKFKKMIDILEYLNIITSTSYSNYEGKNFCKSYGYTNEFTSKVIDKEFELIFCEISEKTYNIIYKYSKIPEDPILLKHYNTIKSLEIDMNKAISFAKQFSNEKFLRVVRDIITIHNKENIIVTEDERTGRIFTSFNLMKKELREFCLYQGEPLDSLDLKSSQPYLLSSLLLQEYPNNKEVQRFYELVTDSDLYDWLIENWGFTDIFSYDESRTLAKKLFFNYLYKKNQGTNSAQQLISKEFPEVYELIKIKKSTEEIWLSLQKLEASIFIPVCNEFVENGCLSVHDSLYFPKEFRGDIERALRENFHKFKLTKYSL